MLLFDHCGVASELREAVLISTGIPCLTWKYAFLKRTCAIRFHMWHSFTPCGLVKLDIYRLEKLGSSEMKARAKFINTSNILTSEEHWEVPRPTFWWLGCGAVLEAVDVTLQAHDVTGTCLWECLQGQFVLFCCCGCVLSSSISLPVFLNNWYTHTHTHICFFLTEV